MQVRAKYRHSLGPLPVSPCLVLERPCKDAVEVVAGRQLTQIPWRFRLPMAALVLSIGTPSLPSRQYCFATR
jgi:hypothetical protein